MGTFHPFQFKPSYPASHKRSAPSFQQQSFPLVSKPEPDAPDIQTQFDGSIRFGHSLAQLPITRPDHANVDLSSSVKEVSKQRIRYAVQEGLQSPSSELPYAKQIQKSFGHYQHTISQIKAHLGEQASAGAEAIHARGYTLGSHVVFARQPDLRTVAHEAAHVVQQHAGVQLPGGIGKVGDIYEQHAEDVADRVISNQSAEELLDRFAGGQNTISPTIHMPHSLQVSLQRAVETRDGKYYSDVDPKEQLFESEDEALQRELGHHPELCVEVLSFQRGENEEIIQA